MLLIFEEHCDLIVSHESYLKRLLSTTTAIVISISNTYQQFQVQFLTNLEHDSMNWALNVLISFSLRQKSIP